MCLCVCQHLKELFTLANSVYCTCIIIYSIPYIQLCTLNIAKNNHKPDQSMILGKWEFQYNCISHVFRTSKSICTVLKENEISRFLVIL